MRNKLNFFIESLFQDKFSILSEYKDLSKYRYGEMCIILINWEKTTVDSLLYRDVTWKNKTTSITIRYENQTDKFIKIVREEWLTRKWFRLF